MKIFFSLAIVFATFALVLSTSVVNAKPQSRQATPGPITTIKTTKIKAPLYCSDNRSTKPPIIYMCTVKNQKIGDVLTTVKTKVVRENEQSPGKIISATGTVKVMIRSQVKTNAIFTLNIINVSSTNGLPVPKKVPLKLRKGVNRFTLSATKSGIKQCNNKCSADSLQTIQDPSVGNTWPLIEFFVSSPASYSGAQSGMIKKMPNGSGEYIDWHPAHLIVY